MPKGKLANAASSGLVCLGISPSIYPSAVVKRTHRFVLLDSLSIGLIPRMRLKSLLRTYGASYQPVTSKSLMGNTAL